MGSGKRGFGIGRISAAPAVGAIALALAGPGVASAAKTVYAAPGIHVGAACTQADPCEIRDALEAADPGDSVDLKSGEYGLPVDGVTIEQAISIGGSAAEKPILLTTPSAAVHVTEGAGAVELHDMQLQGEGGLVLESGSAERLFVDSTDPGGGFEPPAACTVLGHGTALRDSVCWAHEPGGGNGKSSTSALRAYLFGSGVKGTAVFRNVTAVATTAKGDGLLAEATAAGNLTIDARNVIAHSDHGLDVSASTDAEKTVESKLNLNISNTSFSSFHGESGFAEVPAPDSAGNSSAAPLFVDAPSGDFHEAEGSPTLDLGAIDGLLGATDFEGNARSQPKCLGEGASAVPDAGAYERGPTAACPPSPPVPPLPPQPRKPVFRVLKLTLDKSSGRGSVTMEVPGPGVASLTGSGVKFVTRKASAAGTVVMPILPWAISRVRLAKNGRLGVRLKLGFEPTAGARTGLSRRVTLRKSIR